MNASTKIDCDQPIVLAQVDSDNSSTYSNKLLVTGLSEKTRETDMEKFIGSLTRYKLKTGSMVFHARKTDTAMVTFDNDIEYQCIVDKCSSHELQGCKLRFSKVQIQHCVILSKLKETVNEEMILSYFNRNGPVVHKVDVQQRKGRCLVFFDKENDANEALGTEHYFDGQTVTVHRYFTCIERSEPNIISCKRIGDFTVCVSQGNWSEMNFHEIQRHGFTHTSVTDFGVQYVHAKYIWKTSDRFKMLSSWTKRFTLKSIGYILDEYDEESIIRFISWDIIPNEVLDKIYLCSTKNDVLLRLQFALSNPSSSSSEDWPMSSLFSRTQALLTDEKSLLSTSRIPVTPESKGLLKKRRIYDTGDSDNFSSSDDDLTNPWFDRKGVKSTHYEKSQLSTRRIPVIPESKGLFKKRSIYYKGGLTEKQASGHIMENLSYQPAEYLSHQDRRAC
ncbi:uncharacterized protein LOC127881588 isoform X2 [Dreissena polymorpha]|uniref:uncharacterized protein LOC127881588 isoform X2 n=1 Tax=Dreissena polymorpha TaxID=45954 RepID=UPI0022655E11|nr:uncharacterized protein LOC127881588 isoform X2 [Dreissena polymorpha]